MVRDALATIWLTIPDTATRTLQRIGVVLDFAHIEGWRPDETSLRSVRKGLPRQRQEDKHFGAMPYEDVPAYMAKLGEGFPTAGRDCLRLTILTAVRSGESRLVERAEFDLKKATWTVPAGRMKMNETHVVPLSAPALEIVKRRIGALGRDERFLFCSSPDKPISDMTMTAVLRRDKIADLHVHGFRSSFTDWAAEMTEFPKEIVDKALAHKLPDKVEAAYRRTDFFEKRRKLMGAWAGFVSRSKSV